MKDDRLSLAEIMVYQLNVSHFLQKYCKKILYLVTKFASQNDIEVDIDINDYIKILGEYSWLNIFYDILGIDEVFIGVSNKKSV